MTFYTEDVIDNIKRQIDSYKSIDDKIVRTVVLTPGEWIRYKHEKWLREGVNVGSDVSYLEYRGETTLIMKG